MFGWFLYVSYNRTCLKIFWSKTSTPPLCMSLFFMISYSYLRTNKGLSLGELTNSYFSAMIGVLICLIVEFLCSKWLFPANYSLFRSSRVCWSVLGKIGKKGRETESHPAGWYFGQKSHPARWHWEAVENTESSREASPGRVILQCNNSTRPGGTFWPALFQRVPKDSHPAGWFSSTLNPPGRVRNSGDFSKQKRDFLI